MPKRELIKITETVRSAALRRPLVPDVKYDSEIAGFALHLTTRRSFWALTYSPHGRHPKTSKRWGSTRYEFGDAQTMAVTEARSAALAAKALVMGGRDPHREKLAQRASLTAQRGILPTTVREALTAYEQALMAMGAR
jgi:hypothetical protein